MKRRGFLARVLAALGVGAFAAAEPKQLGATVRRRASPPAPPFCSRCGGSGEIPVRGSLGDFSRVMGHREDGLIPDSRGLVYERRPCPPCTPRWKPVRLKSKSYVVDERLAKLWGVPMGVDLNDL